MNEGAEIMNIVYCLACDIGLTGTPVFVKTLSEGLVNSNLYVYTPYCMKENIFSDKVTVITGKINKSCKQYLLGNLVRKSLEKAFKNPNKINVVHINTANINLAYEFIRFFRGKKCKIICHSHNVIKYKNIFPYNLLIRHKKNYIIRYADSLLACSDEAGRAMFGVDADFEVINNALETSKFRFKESSRLKLRQNYEDKTILGHVGAFNEQKNQMFLLQVMKSLDDNFVLMLVGDGPLKETCVKYCKDNGLSNRVIFCGSQTEIQEYYSAFDIFVFPSLHEGFGMVLLEARCSNLNKIVSCYVPFNNVFDAQYVSLEVDKWVEKIQEETKHLNIRRDESDVILQAGFDSRDTISRLKDIYFDITT